MALTTIANQTKQGERFLVVSDVKSLTYSCIPVFRETITKSLDPNVFWSETAENSRSELNNRPGNFPVCCLKVK
jgi:hypothetical protein